MLPAFQVVITCIRSAGQTSSSITRQNSNALRRLVKGNLWTEVDFKCRLRAGSHGKIKDSKEAKIIGSGYTLASTLI